MNKTGKIITVSYSVLEPDVLKKEEKLKLVKIWSYILNPEQGVQYNNQKEIL